jgi:hypothetical protein
MPPSFDGLGRLFVVLFVLAIVGLAALIAGAWWFFSQISIAGGGP